MSERQLYTDASTWLTRESEYLRKTARVFDKPLQRLNVVLERRRFQASSTEALSRGKLTPSHDARRTAIPRTLVQCVRRCEVNATEAAQPAGTESRH